MKQGSICLLWRLGEESDNLPNKNLIHHNQALCIAGKTYSSLTQAAADKWLLFGQKHINQINKHTQKEIVPDLGCRFSYYVAKVEKYISVGKKILMSLPKYIRAYSK